MAKYGPSEKSELYGIFNDSFPPIYDGVTLTVENYVRWIQSMGRTPCVVTPWNPESDEYSYDILRYFSLPIPSRHPYRYGYPKLDPFIWYRLRNSDFKIVHAHCPFSSGRLGVYVKHKLGVPLIGTFHSKYREDLKHSFSGATSWMVDRIMKRILAFFNECDEVWIPQAQVEETVREYGYKGPLTVMENGNDMAAIIKGDVDDYKLRAKEELHIPCDRLALLFVGQHIWEKGLDVVVETLRLLKQSGFPFVMNFIGQGYAAEEIRRRIESYGLQDCVTMRGVIKDRKELSKFYAASDLFLFPSFYDNAPLVVREAAAMAVPSILLEGSTAAEVIRDGSNGFLTEKNPEDFASLVRYLAANPGVLKKVRDGARSTLVRSWRNVVEEVVDRYDTLIACRQNKFVLSNV